MEGIKEGIVKMYCASDVEIGKTLDECEQEIEAIGESVMNFEKKMGYEISKIEISRDAEGKFAATTWFEKPA